MSYNSHKFKQFYYLVIKLTLIFGAAYFIYTKLMHNEALSWLRFKAIISNSKLQFQSLLALLLFTIVNWSFEILKWKVLVNSKQLITFKTALKQSLTAHTASFITPNKIGEYGAKALFFRQDKRKVMLLVFLGNFLQLLVTILFGIFAFYFLVQQFEIHIPYRKVARLTIYGIVFIVALFKGVKHKKSYFFGFAATKVKAAIQYVSKQTISIVFLLSVFRYVVFSMQLYYLLTLFQINISVFEGYVLISSMYLLSAMLPMFSLFDFVLKGAIAVWLFEKIGVDPELILTITTIMWLLNFILPAILGAVGVLNYSKKQQI